MRRIHTLIAGAALLCGSQAALAQSPESPQSPQSPPDTAAPTMPKAGAEKQLGGFDQQFTMKAAAAGMTEVKISEMALQRGTDAVRPIAQRMVKDHSSANQQLMSLAQKMGITLPMALPADKQATVDRLSKLSGPEFDRAYLETLTKSHHASLDLFVQEMKEGSNPELLAFAARIAPIVIEHMALIHASTETAKSGAGKVAPSVPVPPAAGAPPIPTEPKPARPSGGGY